MNNIILPFLMSMLLGRTIDLTTYSIRGGNVYDDSDYNEVPVKELNTTYAVLQDDKFPHQFFGIPVDVVLRIKSNFLSTTTGFFGLDAVLKDTSWKYNSAVIAATAIYRTMERVVKEDAKPFPEWTEKVPVSQTHYAHKLYYGGWIVVLFRFKCDIPGDVQAVRNVLTKHLGVIGEVGVSTMDKWNAAVKEIKDDTDIRGDVKIFTHVYSTTATHHVIDSPETFFSAIRKLPEDVGEKGNPLFMSLMPLHQLNEKYPVVEQHTDMLTQLEKLDEMFDDVKIAKVKLMNWISETMTSFEDDQEERISTMIDVLNACIKVFNQLGGEVSLYKPANLKLLNSANRIYIEGLPKGVTSYNLALRSLKEDIDADCEFAFLHKIRGLLRVYDEDMQDKGEVKGGLEECKKLCFNEKRCRAIGFAGKVTQLDLTTGLYLEKKNLCWVYFRSTNTAPVYTPPGLSGDIGVYDRRCYF